MAIRRNIPAWAICSRAKGGNVSQEMNNPYLSGMADTIARKATSNYENSIAPQIRSSAQAAGQFGGSRQGVIEANALKDLNQGISDSLTNLYGSAYDQAQNRGLQMANMALQSQAQNNQASNSVGDLALRGLLGTGQLNLAADNQNFNQQAQGVGLLNQANQNQIGNYQSLLNLGGVQQQDQQNQINADMARWDYNQTAPWQALQNYMGLITGAGGRYGEGSVGQRDSAGIWTLRKLQTQWARLLVALAAQVVVKGIYGPVRRKLLSKRYRRTWQCRARRSQLPELAWWPRCIAI